MKTVAPGVLALAASVNAAYQGFNYGNIHSDGSAKTQSDFESEFTTAAGLDGTDGAFNSARIYTMIQADTDNDVISAIPAAISTDTSLLLGLWCSAGSDAFANEITALKKAISTYGSDLASLVAGISVGSEDLYRITPTGIANGEDPGAEPDVIADYISQVRDAISGTVLSDAKIGHVDTWTVWVNSSNSAVIDAVDWIGVDEYPYWEEQHANGIDNSKTLFDDAVAESSSGTGGKEVWITETGWPVTGDTVGDAVASTENAEKYWNMVGCPTFGVTNVWWYTLQESGTPDFGVIGSTLTTTPRYDLSCANASNETATSTATAAAAATASGTVYNNGTTTGSNSTSSSGSGSSSSSSGSSSSSDSSSDSSGDSSGDDGSSTISSAARLGSLGAGVLAIMAAALSF